MTPSIYNATAAFIGEHLPDLCNVRVLEIGSLIVPGQENIAIRKLFKNCARYTGVDYQPGNGVDIVAQRDIAITAKAYRMAYDWTPVETRVVVYCEAYEHDPDPFTTILLLRSTQPHYIVFSSPTQNFPLHRHPKDYRRIMQDEIMDVVMKDYEITALTTLPDGAGNECWFAVGSRRK